ncbi:MAG: GTPase [Phycisphaerae bacterium]
MTIAACLTAQTPAAISTVMVLGADAEKICARACASSASKFRAGSHFVATLRDGNKIIDEVLAGCEAEGKIALHCHGNPIITQAALELLERCGARIAEPVELCLREAALQSPDDAIAQEAQVYSSLVPSMRACRLINACGLKDAAVGRLKQPHLACEQAKTVLEKSKIAARLFGISRIAIAGAPNAGKSTLINQLAGKQVAIVTEVRGTTRDWVSARGKIGDFDVEFIDTAGLDSSLSGRLDEAGQKKTREITAECEAVIALLEPASEAEQLELVRKAAGDKIILPVLNKCDLQTSAGKAGELRISALTGENIPLLIDKIIAALEPEPLAENDPVCFTRRQMALVERIAAGDDSAKLCRELLSGKPSHTFDLNAVLPKHGSLVE